MESQWQKVGQVLRKGLQEGIYPGYQAVIADRQEILWQETGGLSRQEPEEKTMKADHLFDLASLTKPVATMATCLQLLRQGELSLDEPVRSFMPPGAPFFWDQVTLGRLLDHTSGLPAWYPLYTRGQGREEVWDFFRETELENNPGEKTVYSCLGFILLGLLLEKIGAASLDELARELVFVPLQMENTTFRPLDQGYYPEDLVWQEKDSQREKGMVSRGGLEFSGWREGFSPGEPNDGNSAYALGGIAGNAGLFAPPADIARFGQAWLGSETGKGFLSPAIIEAATRSRGGEFGLGWRLKQTGHPQPGFPESMAPFIPNPIHKNVGPRVEGELFSGDSFGHSGFTGCSLWIDPRRNLVCVLFAPHLHPTLTPGFNRIRARFHNVVAAVKEEE